MEGSDSARPPTDNAHIPKAPGEATNQTPEASSNKRYLRDLPHMTSIALELQGDSEFYPQVNQPTHPHSLGLKAEPWEGKELPFQFYLHPKHTSKVVKHEVFDSPCALMSYLTSVMDAPFELIPSTNKRGKHILTVKYFMFWSFKDIEHLFADREFYKEYVLPHLNRTRRITGKIALPYKMKVGRRSYAIGLEIVDISAMQGADKLKNYALNVGIKMDYKETYNLSQKKDMPAQYDKDPDGFVEYNGGDLILPEIYRKTCEYYNWVASLVGVEPRASWGMSTGKIVASITSAWLQKETGLTPTELTATSQLAGTEGLYNLQQLRKTKELVYLPMVDGGRAARESYIASVFFGILCDIDIAGCYGNGLLNQDFPIGNPTVFDTPMTLREWLKKVYPQLSPGLWYFRVSTKGKMPFRQDLLISKEEDAFTNWENGILLGDSRPDEEKVYDASMVLLRQEVRHASLTHDLFQALKGTASKPEWSWLQDNLIFESGLAYLKKDEVTDIKDLDVKGMEMKKVRASRQGIEWSTAWYRVPLKEFIGTLLDERQKVKHDPNWGKKSPRDIFLKLIINTVYGCTASEFFSTEAVSNVVVGNNITGRARTLAWCMAKGLQLRMAVTDGGVFDVNKVIFYKSMSLGKLEKVSQGCLITEERGELRKFADEGVLGRGEGGFYQYEKSEGKNRKYAEEGGLGGKFWTEEDITHLMTKPNSDADATNLDLMAWKHLSNQFPFLDIFSLNQYSFETKNMYNKLLLHSKVDYMMVDFNGKVTVALRGADKILINDPKGGEVKVTDPQTLKLFEAIEEDVPYRYEVETEQMLSLNDYRKGLSSGRFGNLLPHDTYSKTKQFYSHTPMFLPFDTLTDYRNTMKDYEAAKLTKDPVVVKKLVDDYLRDYLRR